MLMLVVKLPPELRITYDFHFWIQADVEDMQLPPLFGNTAAPVYHCVIQSLSSVLVRFRIILTLSSSLGP